jgi:hypothetical protein
MVGTNGFGGVTVMANTASTVSANDGKFSFLLSVGGSYVIVPQPQGYFTPSSSNVVLSSNVSNIVFNSPVNFYTSASIFRTATNTNLFMLSFPAIASTTYRIQTATNLPATNWVDIATNTATGGVLFYTYTPTTNFPRRFFRTVTP